MVVTADVVAQPSPSEHEKHHPKAPGGPAEGSGPPEGAGPPAGAGPGMMQDMGKMMEKMGAPKPRDLYPSLMRLPDLPPEERAEVQRQAHERMKAGAVLMSEGLESLSQAAPSEDYAGMQAAVAKLKEGVSQFDSGLAAHRALAEGKAPRSVALQWFKREMNLLPPAEGDTAEFRLWGMTLFHAGIMATLVIFAVVMIAMYFFKMRRAASLLEKLAIGNAAGAATVADAPTPATSAPAAKENRTAAMESSADCCGSSADTCPTEEDAPADAHDSQGLLPVVTKKLCRLRITRIIEETADVKTFRLVACHGGGIPFSYLPGQFLTLTLPVDEKPIRRSYTISSSPTQGYYCEITVKREDQGTGSRYLHDRVSVGDTLEVKAPSGKFSFTGKEADSIVLIAGGVGITPMMSIARALTDMSWDGEIYFIVACQDPEHFIFEAELKRLAEHYDNVHLFVAMSRIEEDANGYRKGRLSKEMLAEWVPDIGSKWIQLCGAPPMMDAVKQMLAELDVPDDRIHTENFGSTQKPKAKVAEGQEARAAEAESAQGGTVTFATSDTSTQLQPDETVLEASERVGVDINYSCRVGTCGECRVKLLSGDVSMAVEDGLEPGDKDQRIILACQAKSEGDVTVDA